MHLSWQDMLKIGFGPLHSCPRPPKSHPPQAQTRSKSPKRFPGGFYTASRAALGFHDLIQKCQETYFAIQTHSDSHFCKIEYALNSTKSSDLQVNSLHSKSNCRPRWQRWERTIKLAQFWRTTGLDSVWTWTYSRTNKHNSCSCNKNKVSTYT